MRTATTVDRRQFLRASAGAGAAACGAAHFIPSAALGKDGQTAASNRVVLGSSGVGSMGRGDMKSLMRAATSAGALAYSV